MLSRLMTRREQFVVGFLGLAIVAGAAALLWSKSADSGPVPPEINSPAPGVPVAPAPVSPKIPAAEPPAREVAVSVVGAVGKPGVYRLDDDSRIEDLISAAGGLRGADTTDINLAARLIDGTTLSIPPRVDETLGADPAAERPVVINPAPYTISGQGAAASGASSPGVASSLIDINRATQAELETLPGIGPKLAQQIIQFRSGRRFGEIAEMMDVPGIGPQRFEAIRELITVN